MHQTTIGDDNAETAVIAVESNLGVADDLFESEQNQMTLPLDYLQQPFPKMAYIKNDPNMHLKLTRCESTDSGVPPSPIDPDSGDTMCRDDCFPVIGHDNDTAPAAALLFTGDYGNHGNGGSELEQRSSNIVDQTGMANVGTSRLFSFCNDIYMRQSTGVTVSRAAKLHSVSVELKSNRSSYTANSIHGNEPVLQLVNTDYEMRMDPNDRGEAASSFTHDLVPSHRINNLLENFSDPYLQMAELPLASPIDLPMTSSPDDEADKEPPHLPATSPSMSRLTNSPYIQVSQLDTTTSLDVEVGNHRVDKRNVQASVYILHSNTSTSPYVKGLMDASCSIMPPPSERGRIEITTTLAGRKEHLTHDEIIKGALSPYSQMTDLPKYQIKPLDHASKTISSIGQEYFKDTSASILPDSDKESKLALNQLQYTVHTKSNSHGETDSDAAIRSSPTHTTSTSVPHFLRQESLQHDKSKSVVFTPVGNGYITTTRPKTI